MTKGAGLADLGLAILSPRERRARQGGKLPTPVPGFSDRAQWAGRGLDKRPCWGLPEGGQGLQGVWLDSRTKAWPVGDLRGVGN